MSNENGDRNERNGDGLLKWMKGLLRGRGGEPSLRESLEEIIEDFEEKGDSEAFSQPVSDHERTMLGNIFQLRQLTAYDVMVPRADVVAVSDDISMSDLIETFTKGGHSRLPVYHETLDDVQALVHIKDVVPAAAGKQPFDLAAIVREILIIAPSMPVLDLLLQMRLSRVHMALVVDEYGGIDGLITIEDLVEEIVGEIEDEHDPEASPQIVERGDGAMIVDARVDIEDLEERLGPFLSDEEREEDIDTLGGLVFSLAGRVPARGELISHPESGFTFEVMEADPRRIKRVRLRRPVANPQAPAKAVSSVPDKAPKGE